mmetsp:Transcript_83582/g.147294  ORF Transcript_83582/g.147294 Transcript_83582/m.147294 type:complete len:650 (-) Transcript_83582:73-2022(-)
MVGEEGPHHWAVGNLTKDVAVAAERIPHKDVVVRGPGLGVIGVATDARLGDDHHLCQDPGNTLAELVSCRQGDIHPDHRFAVGVIHPVEVQAVPVVEAELRRNDAVVHVAEGRVVGDLPRGPAGLKGLAVLLSRTDVLCEGCGLERCCQRVEIDGVTVAPHLGDVPLPAGKPRHGVVVREFQVGEALVRPLGNRVGTLGSRCIVVAIVPNDPLGEIANAVVVRMDVLEALPVDLDLRPDRVEAEVEAALARQLNVPDVGVGVPRLAQGGGDGGEGGAIQDRGAGARPRGAAPPGPTAGAGRLDVGVLQAEPCDVVHVAERPAGVPDPQRVVVQGHRRAAVLRPGAGRRPLAPAAGEERLLDGGAGRRLVAGLLRGAVERVPHRLDPGIVAEVVPGGPYHERRGGRQAGGVAGGRGFGQQHHPRPLGHCAGEPPRFRVRKVQHVGRGCRKVDGGDGDVRMTGAVVLAQVHVHSHQLINLADFEDSGEVARSHIESGHLRVHDPIHHQLVPGPADLRGHRLALVVQVEGVALPPGPDLARPAPGPRGGRPDRPRVHAAPVVGAVEGGGQPDLLRDPGLRFSPQVAGDTADVRLGRPEGGLREKAGGVGFLIRGNSGHVEGVNAVATAHRRCDRATERLALHRYVCGHHSLP